MLGVEMPVRGSHTRGHIDEVDFDPTQAKRATIRLGHSRVKAHGYKWRQWYLRQHLWRDSTSKMVPEEHQDYICITCNMEAEYKVSDKLTKLYDDHVKGRQMYNRFN